MTKEQEVTKVKEKLTQLIVAKYRDGKNIQVKINRAWVPYITFDLNELKHIEKLKDICNYRVEPEVKKESEKDLEVLWIAKNSFGRWALIIHNKDQADKIRTEGGEIKRVVVC